MYNTVDEAARLNTIIDVINNQSAYINLRAKELQKWHKIWFYCYSLMIIILLIMITIIVRVSKYRLKKKLPAQKKPQK